MTWKEGIDSIKIICKDCGEEMILESNFSNNSGIFSCRKCKEYINIRVMN